VEPRFVEWKGTGSPLQWVISENLIRRHLTSSQRAVVAHDLLPMLEKEAKERQRLSLGRGKKVCKHLHTFSDDGKSRQVAARIAKTNHTYVQAVKAIAVEAPELLDKIRSGVLKVPDAAKLAKLPKGERRQLLKRCDGEDRTDGKLGSPTFVFNGSGSPRPNTIATPPSICKFLHDLIAPKYKVKTILDPSAGSGALTRPWKGAKVISFEIAKGRDFFDCPDHINCDICLCNPPFNASNGESRFLPKVFLERIVTVVPPKTPIVLFTPMALRLDQTSRSSRWRWLRDHAPPITSIVTLPHDAFGSVKVHSEILIFSASKLEPHYFLPDKYLR
jgi:hypothetical protein